MPPPSHDQDESLAALGRVVSGLREERELTREELARRADLQETELALIESGRRNPAWGVVRRISQALGLSLPELIRQVEELEREG